MQGKRLTIREAARLIYGPQPSAAQIGNVLRKVKEGEIEAARAHGRWTTTPDQIASYLARQALRQQRRTPHLHPAGTLAAGFPQQQSEHDLRSTYQSMLRDYFLALLFRRRAHSASSRFRHAVTIGQATAVLLMVLSFVLVVRPAIWAAEPPERRAIEAWIEANLGECEVIRWSTPEPNPEGNGQLIRVQFIYHRRGGKKINSELAFLLIDGQVQSVDSASLTQQESKS